MAQLEQDLLNSKPCAGRVGPAYVSDTEKPAEGALQDGSKPLGMHITAIRKFLSDHPEVTTQCLTTEQTNQRFIKHDETQATHKPTAPYIDKYVGQKDENGVALVAPATVFVSHAWKYSFANTVADAMEQHAEKEPNAYFWFDLFANDQNAIEERDFDWFSNTFKRTIRDIGKVLVILSPWNDPIPLSRAWCLFEISTALIEKDVELIMCLPDKEVSSMSSLVQDNRDCLIQALTNIQAEKAEASKECDQNKIFDVIKGSEGGFSSVNNHVKTKLREWYVDKLRHIVSETKYEVKLLDAVGYIFTALGIYDEGLQYIKQSLSIKLSSRHGEHHPDVARSYQYMADVYRDKGALDKAMKYYQKSLSIRLSIQGDHHPDVASSYNTIANVYGDKGDLYKAMEYYQKSLSIRLSTLGDHHSDVATSYNNMASVYVNEGSLDTAMKYYEKSLSIKLSNLGEHHPDVARSYNNMATVCRKMGDLDEAMEYCQKSLSIRLSILGDHHPDVATSYNKMASVYRDQGALDKSMEYCQKSLSISRSALGENHPDVATSYDNMANVHGDQGDSDKAIKYCRKSLSIRHSILGDHHPDLAISYTNMADVYKHQGDLDTALEYYQKSKSMLSILGENHPAVASLNNKIASVHKDKR